MTPLLKQLRVVHRELNNLPPQLDVFCGKKFCSKTPEEWSGLETRLVNVLVHLQGKLERKKQNKLGQASSQSPIDPATTAASDKTVTLMKDRTRRLDFKPEGGQGKRKKV